MAERKSKIDSLFQTGMGSAANASAFSLRLNGKDYPLVGEKVRIGRALDNEIVVDDKSSSRYHAVISIEIQADGSFVFTLEDLQSRNGIRVNRKRVSRAVLKPNDHVEIGDLSGMFLQQKQHRTSQIQPPTEDTATGRWALEDEGNESNQASGDEAGAGAASLVQKFQNLPKGRKLMVVGGGVLFVFFAFVFLAGGGSPQKVRSKAKLVAAVQVCDPSKMVNEDVDARRFEECQEHEDLGNLRLARACFQRLPPTVRVCEAVGRVATTQETLAQSKFKEGARAFDNYYYDQAILKWQQVLLIADRESEWRQKAEKGLEEAQEKRAQRR